MPVMRAMALAFPGNALTRVYETQFMCGDVAARRADRPRGRRSRGRAASRRVVRPQFAPALSGPARAALQGRARPVSRCSAAKAIALPLGRAVQHTGEIDAANPLEQLWVFGAPDALARRASRRRRSRPGADGAFAIRATAERQGRALRRRRRHRRRRPAGLPVAHDAHRPRRIAVTAGEPAGIGPELVALLAVAPSRAPVSGAARRRSAIATCSTRARRGSASRRRYADYDRRVGTAPAANGRDLASAARRAGDARATPIRPTRTACSRRSRAPPTRARPAPSRRS